MINSMERVFISLTEETDMKENWQEESNPDMDVIFTLMVTSMKENGLMIKNTEKVFILIN